MGKKVLTTITFSDIHKLNRRKVICIRDNIKGGALTETTLLVLLATYEPKHGYGILKFIERETEGRVVLGAGTLYGAINILLKKKWLMLVCNEQSDHKKEYEITEHGRRIVEQEFERLQELSSLASEIIGGEQKLL